jgi:hypothetical protein
MFGFTIVALATTLTLPGRQTPAIIEKSGGALSGIYRSVITGER